MHIFSQLGKEGARIALESRHEKITADASWTQFGAAWPSAASVQQNARRAAKPVVVASCDSSRHASHIAKRKSRLSLWRAL